MHLRGNEEVVCAPESGVKQKSSLGRIKVDSVFA